MEIPSPASNTQADHNSKRSRNRLRHARQTVGDQNTQRHSQPPPDDTTPDATVAGDGDTSTSRVRTKRRKPGSKNTDVVQTGNSNHGPSEPPADKKNRRGARFNAGLTDSNPASQASSSSKSDGKPTERYRIKPGTNEELATDLATTLARALRIPPYPDCPICFSSIHPAQRTWSCSPSIPIIRPPDAAIDEQQYCWTTFHVKCIGEWAIKSVKEVTEAWRARGEAGRKGDWRCPGCQAKRETVPSGYWCFCNSTAEPKPPRLATPHSCANPCSRVRESGCGHSCPLACHPGPCPPCQITTRLQCYCPRKKTTAFRCGIDQGGKAIAGGKGRELSCGSSCGRKLDCGKHTCQGMCHDGPCEGCSVREVVKCYCGSSEREVRCGEGEGVRCIDRGDEREWLGRFGCPKPCQKIHDCQIHRCDQVCHPPHLPTPCPLSPVFITHCPCGKHPITPTSSSVTTSAFPFRQNCTSPIPTCTSSCGKLQAECSHPCVATCHTGPCSPCSVILMVPCRCGAVTKKVFCYELGSSSRGNQGDGKLEPGEILCDKPCMALRACNRHQCRRICCPLAALASGKKGKQRRPAIGVSDVAVGEEAGGLHECDLVCGKTLVCGLHKCEDKDHRGACPPCLRSSFEELFCHCGRTVLEPPIPCGTKIECNYPCTLQPPPCGHPMTPHTCHEDPLSPCPPCPFLATRECACRKKMMGNIRCSLEKEKVSCGTVCGKLMACGFHHCDRLCHAGECGVCTITCGKLRKHCLPMNHPCPLPCHAPSACSEDAPCQSLVTLSCPCARIKHFVPCGRSAANPSGHQQLTPKCNNECAIAKRNARLAEALGITAESREKLQAQVVWNEELLGSATANTKFLAVVEKAFEEFVSSGKKTQMLPHMPLERRKFVHDVAVVYRMDTEMVDQEPHRSVRLLRRLDTRIPTPLLSSTITGPLTAQPNLGKLAELRSGGSSSTTTPSWRSHIQSKPGVANAASAKRGPAWVQPPKSLSGVSIVATPSKAPATTSSNATGPVKESATASISRASTPAPTPHVSSEAVPVSPGVVPDNWEDDV